MDLIVRADNLTKRFDEYTAVDSLNLEIPSGEIFSLLGPNGAGKTTTIRMLMGILRPTEGTVTIGGLDCFADRAEVMRFVGYMPDEPSFYEYLKGEEILFFVARMHGMRRGEAQKAMAPLVEMIGLEGDLEEYAVNYSRGMKKKLALVCALMHDPDFLILDEPTNGLDPYATRVVHRILQAKVQSGKSVFFSTHLLDQAEKLSDRVGILNNGRLAAVGRLDDLRDSLSPGGSLEDVFFAVAASEGKREDIQGESA